MFIQTEDKYKTIMLGHGTGSIFNFGCFEVSLTNGLNKHGWKFTPESFNEALKSKGCWTGPYNNYINVDKLDESFPEIFESYQKVEPWNDMAQLEDLLDNINGTFIVLGKVSAKGIGGSGTHFVLIDDVDGNNAIIHDPWTGEYQPVSNRYGKLGNILGLRVFKIKQNKGDSDMENEELTTCMDDRKKFWAERDLARTERDEALREIENIKTKLEGEVNAHKATKKKHNLFIDTLAKIFRCVHSEESVIKFATENSKVIDERDKLEVALGKEVQARKNDVIAHQNELSKLKQQIDDLKKEVVSANTSNDRLTNKLNNLESQINSKLDETDEAKKKIEDVESEIVLGIWARFKKWFNTVIVQTLPEEKE